MSISYEMAWAQTFQTSMTKLPPTHQAAVIETIGKLQKGLGSTHLHALAPMKWVSFCVSRDAVRIICDREGSTLVLAWVDFHTDAYRWAERHTPERFGSVVRFVRVAVDDDDNPAETSAPQKQHDERPPGPLQEFKDKTFRLFEVTPGLAALLRTVPDEDTLLELCARLDKPLAEALVSLAADPDALQGVLARFHEAKKGETLTLGQAVKASVNAERLWVVPPEQAALEAALSGDAETWRVFLHPSQKRLVTMKTSGAYLVTGGPGTGKTIVALHRARHLAETLSEKAADPRPVLVTTFSRVLAAQLDEGLDTVCRDMPKLKQRFVVTTLTGAARNVLELAKEPSALLVGEDIDACWEEALKVDVLKKGRRFFEREREEIVLPKALVSEEAYLKAARTGRGEKLERASKKQVWAVLAAYEAALNARRGDDAGGLARRATELLRQRKVASPFAAVVCDEVQDASLWELQLLAALAVQPGAVEPGGDRLFLVGDGHQRLYQRPTSLRACGIEIRGRSARLRLNYRTTHGICAAALEVLAGVTPDVLEEEAEAVADGYRSVRAGKRPEQHTFATAEAEADFIATSIRESKERPFLVLARTKTMLEGLRERLRVRGVTAALLGDEVAQAKDAVLLATLHRSKGLEAPRVVLAGAQESPGRFPGGDDADKTLWLRKERLLQYVGMTRARDWCAVTRAE
ncbi:MAG: 3'-5' exonuclease [Deltaproteobacteria bacterium]|nr:3'-5' exonuclease [Deltaproteobacteria bacterium]